MTKELTTPIVTEAMESTENQSEANTATAAVATATEEQQQQQQQPRKKRAKIMSACSECRRKKTKCNGEQPCRNCQKSNASCIYSTAATSGSGSHGNTGPHINAQSSMAASASSKRYFHYQHSNSGNGSHGMALSTPSKAGLEAIEDRLKAIEDMLQTIINNSQHYQLPILQHTATQLPHMHRPEIVHYDYHYPESSYNSSSNKHSNIDHDDKHRLPSIRNLSSGIHNATTTTSSPSPSTAVATTNTTAHTYTPQPSAFSTVSQQPLPTTSPLVPLASREGPTPSMRHPVHAGYHSHSIPLQQQHPSSPQSTASTHAYAHTSRPHPTAFEPIGKRKREDLF